MADEYSTELKAGRRQSLRRIYESLVESSDGERIMALLEQYHFIFVLSEEDRGETSLVSMSLDTGSDEPIFQPLRRTPFSSRKEIAKQIEKMQRGGIIVPSHSPWSSPVVLADKKDGTLRFCVDYRMLNAVTKPDWFPLARPDDIFDKIGQACYFSTSDLKTGYWQIRMSRESQEKTTYATEQSLFEFKVMPFGLRNAPAVFQRLMKKVLDGLNADGDFVAVYLDDIRIFLETVEEHLRHLALVFRRLVEAGLRLNPAKCCFLQKEVDYLGHTISAGGLRPNQSLVEAVGRFAVPRTIRALWQFLGLTSYYRRFIPRYAVRAASLYAQLRKR